MVSIVKLEHLIGAQKTLNLICAYVLSSYIHLIDMIEKRVGEIEKVQAEENEIA